MNQREKEEYLRGYSIQKSTGKPFFPYAIAKDAWMAVIVMIAIMGLAIVLGAELGPKANPATTSYTPRPEWYFFFLFEVLRVFKPPACVGLAVSTKTEPKRQGALWSIVCSWMGTGGTA